MSSDHVCIMYPVCTFVFHVEAGVADGAVTAEGQVHEVGRALHLLGQLAVLEASQQVGVAVGPVVDVQEVIVGLDAEAEREKKEEPRRRTRQIVKNWIVVCRHQGLNAAVM